MNIFDRFTPLFNAYLGSSRKGKLKPSTHEIRGYKKAQIVFKGGKVSFRSPTYGTNFGVVAHAVCGGERSTVFSLATLNKGAQGVGHSIADCTCGFHAFKNMDEAFEYGGVVIHFSPNSHEEIVLETVASGQYIEYSRGYRSESQRVSSVLVGFCIACQEEDVVAEAATCFVHFGETLYPVCEKHAQEVLPRRCYTFDDVAKRIPLPRDFKHAKPVVKSASDTVVPSTRAAITVMKPRRVVEMVGSEINWLRNRFQA